MFFFSCFFFFCEILLFFLWNILLLGHFSKLCLGQFEIFSGWKIKNFLGRIFLSGIKFKKRKKKKHFFPSKIKKYLKILLSDREKENSTWEKIRKSIGENFRMPEKILWKWARKIFSTERKTKIIDKKWFLWHF